MCKNNQLLNRMQMPNAKRPAVSRLKLPTFWIEILFLLSTQQLPLLFEELLKHHDSDREFDQSRIAEHLMR